MIEWKDVSSYSRGDEQKIPNDWQLITRSLRINVHRHKDYDSDMWLLSCYDVAKIQMPLRCKNINYAKKEAIELVQHILKTMLKELE